MSLLLVIIRCLYCYFVPYKHKLKLALILVTWVRLSFGPTFLCYSILFNLFSLFSVRQAAQGGQQDVNMLSLFLQSLMPSFGQVILFLKLKSFNQLIDVSCISDINDATALAKPRKKDTLKKSSGKSL